MSTCKDCPCWSPLGPETKLEDGRAMGFCRGEMPTVYLVNGGSQAYFPPIAEDQWCWPGRQIMKQTKYETVAGSVAGTEKKYSTLT